MYAFAARCRPRNFNVLKSRVLFDDDDNEFSHTNVAHFPEI